MISVTAARPVTCARGGLLAFTGTSRFELIRKLGEGGMGVVYEAHDRQQDMRVALKALRHLDASSLYRFKREFRSLTDISHPNIIGLYDLVSEGNDWFFTMELVPGTDFLTYVRPGGWQAPTYLVPTTTMDSSERQGTLATRQIEADAVALPTEPDVTAAPPPELPHFEDLVDERRLRRGLVQLAQALDTLHRAGMVHRDLKPSNIRVTPGERVVLMDFGIVSESGRLEDSSDPRTLGTPAFMAPEQAAGESPSPAADWYSFGIVLYMALTGQLPFRGDRHRVLVAKQTRDPLPPERLAAGVPPDLGALCQALLRRETEQRPNGADVLVRLGIHDSDQAVGDATTLGGEHTFVGRERELAHLHELHRQMRGEQTVAVFVVGESGMGKSTLVRRFLHELEAKSGALPIVLRGRCHERESLPYKAFDGVVDSLSRFLLGLSEQRVASLLPEEIDLLTRLFPVLRQVPGIQTARPLGGLDPHDLRTRAFLALRELLRNLASWRPLTLYIDDLQWADRDSADLLLEVLRSPDAPRCLLLVAIRAENVGTEDEGDVVVRRLMDTIAAQHICRQVRVGPLSAREQATLVRRLLGEGAAEAGAGEAYWAESAGSPLFLGELIRFAQEGGPTVVTEQPPRLEDVLFRRIERLPAGARTLLEAVVVAGEPTPLWVLAAAVDLSAYDRERAAAVLRVTHLVRVARQTKEPWLASYHDRVRETLTARLAADRLRDLHQRMAQALERWEDATVDSLARHWLAAGDRHQATTYIVSAARAAKDKLAFGRAAELYRAALDVGEHDAGETRQLLRALADVLALAGRAFEAAETYQRAAAGAGSGSDPGDVLELTRLAADNLLRSGHIELGMAALRDVMRRLEVSVPRTRRGAKLSLLVQRLRVSLRGVGFSPRAESEVAARDLGRLDTLYAASTTLGMIDHIRGAALQTRHLLHALRFGEERRACRALAIEAVFRAAAGGRALAQAHDLSHDIELRARRIGDPYLVAIAKLAVGAAAFFDARMRASAVAFGEAERILTNECVGAEWERITARYFFCQSHVGLGNLDEVAKLVGRFIEEAERRSDYYALNLFRTQPSTWRWLTQDKPAQAWGELDGALEGWPTDEYFNPHHFALTTRVYVYQYEGRHHEAIELLQGAMPDIRRSMIVHIPWAMAEYYLLLGRSAAAVGDERAWRSAVRFMDRFGKDIGHGIAALLRGSWAMRAGDEAAAQQQLLRAVTHLEEAGFHLFAEASRYRLGEHTRGSQGESLQAAVLAWMEQKGVKNPQRMIDLNAPRPAS
jgi:hypothetical protein